ncbi:hypothetical protein F4824DRAFT_507990 [Ustulina deusta]|nr:hypothetical protein F4824DRAFT_507990 [Ustulina deusta]
MAYMYDPSLVSDPHAVVWGLDPLNNPAATIRLAPVTTDQNLTNTEYVYLSHDWSAVGHGTISINGSLCVIPEGLHGALSVVAAGWIDRRLFFWQGDQLQPIGEQDGHPICIMQKYVMDAKGTLCWLGSEEPWTGKVFTILREASRQWNLAIVEQASRQGISEAEKWRGLSSKLRSCHIPDLQSCDDTLCRALEAIFDSSYWTSTQRILEIVLSKRVVLHCGRFGIDLDDCIAAFRALQFLPGIPQRPRIRLMEGYIVAFETNFIRKEYLQHRSIKTRDLLRVSRSCQFRDLNQMVFDMFVLSITSRDLNPFFPQHHYGKPTSELFIETASFIVADEQRLNIWCFEVPPSFGEDLAVNRWNETHEAILDIRVSPNNNLLVRAHFLDQIAGVSPILDADNVGRLCSEEFHKIYTRYGEPMRTVEWKRFSKTLVLGFVGHEDIDCIDYPSPENVYASFLSYIREWRHRELPEALPVRRTRLESKLGRRVSSELFEQLLQRNTFGRRLFETTCRNIGMTAVEDVRARTVTGGGDRTKPTGDQQSVPDNQDQGTSRVAGVSKDDWVVALLGGYTHYIIRPKQRNSYEFVGECYLFEAMKTAPHLAEQHVAPWNITIV